MRIADQLKALRLATPGRPGVRAIARAMGYDLPNTYGYYEGATFNKSVLPLEKAREIATAFDKLGGDGAAVLRLAGLADTEVAQELIDRPKSTTFFIPMTVAFPSEDAMTQMMRGLLKGVGLDEVADSHAETLAQRLPEALAQASGQLVGQGSATAINRVVPPSPNAKRDLSRMR